MSSTLRDLCPEDKRKVARLLQKVGELGKELKATEAKLAKESLMAGKARSLKRRGQKIELENQRLQAVLTQQVSNLKVHKAQIPQIGPHTEELLTLPLKQCHPNVAAEEDCTPIQWFPAISQRLSEYDQSWLAHTAMATELMEDVEACCLDHIFQVHGSDFGGSGVSPGSLRYQASRHSAASAERLVKLCLEADASRAQDQFADARIYDSNPAFSDSHPAFSACNSTTLSSRDWPKSQDDVEEMLNVIYEAESDALEFGPGI